MPTQQMSIFDLRLPPVAEVQHPTDEPSLDLRFARWLEQNPAVLDVFVDVSLQAHHTGRTRIGAKRIVEQMRWDTRLPTTGDAFKLNNSFVSRLARAAVGRRPELADLFEFRELRS